MRFLVALAALVALSPHVAEAAESIGGDSAFSFVALGDMPYNVPADYAKFDRLIASINALKPAFSIHVGDIKNSSSACTDETFKKVYDQFQTFEQPLLYAIGDNEWTDCHRYKRKENEPAELTDPRARLAKLREMFFARPDQSLGKSVMAVESQGLVMPAHAKYVENSRFTKNGVLFVSLNIPGSNNGFEIFDLQASAEYFERNRANIGWIDDGFRKAIETGAKAMVLAFQANPYVTRLPTGVVPPNSGFLDTLNAIERGAQAFGRPVLVIQGDMHMLEITGFRNAKGALMPNVWRLQVMGETQVHAVRVVVDPDSPGVFGFVPLIVPANGNF
jgi:hypothetical protein